MDKDSILKNYKLAVLQRSGGNWLLLKDGNELTRMVDNDEIGNGDLVIRLTPEMLKVAIEKNYIEIK